MTIRPDSWIRNMSLEHDMIQPFVSQQVKDGCISFGLSSFGYDIRISNEYKFIPKPNLLKRILIWLGLKKRNIIDPKKINSDVFEDFVGDIYIMPPHSFVLARSVESFIIPRNIMCICLGKSTYARCGLIVNVTPLEAEWEGILTIEISNTTPLPAKIYSNEGIAQLLFFESDKMCEVSYADRRGKYQDQTEITLPRI